MGKKKDEIVEKILDVDASMQGTITFRDPVNLRINGSFEGKLDTRGTLTIGEHASIKADIIGDTIIIAGRVIGDVSASQKLLLVAPAQVKGNIKAPVLGVAEGAILEGYCSMPTAQAAFAGAGEFLSLEEMARFLEVETAVLNDWARSGKIPAIQEGNSWKFKRSDVDRWIQEERVKV